MTDPNLQLHAIAADGTVPSLDAPLPHEAPGVLEATRALYGRVGFVPPWTGYLAAEGDVVVGTCGFVAPPADGRVEIAYFTFPAHEGRGVARAMAAALVAIARQAAPDATVAARTLRERNASHRILERLGFTCRGEVEDPDDGPVLEWRLVDGAAAG